MASLVHMKVGDSRPWIFSFNSDGDSDFTDVASAKLYMRLESGGANKIDGGDLVIGTKTTAAAAATYSPITADMDTAGRYRAYVLVTFTTGTKTARFPSNGYDTVVIEESYE